MRHHYRTNRAFTLIELLTVIAIIALLAALLFPAIKGAMLKAEVSKAQTGAVGLAIAFKAYYTEYGTWPVSGPVSLSNQTFIVDSNLVAVLQGANNTASLTGAGATGTLIGGVGTSALQGNARGIRFHEFKAADLGGSPACPGCFLDPWKQPYFCRFDVSSANQVPDPFTGGGVPQANVNAGFLVWSAGPDGQFDNNGDVPPSGVNKDNVKSW